MPVNSYKYWVFLKKLAYFYFIKNVLWIPNIHKGRLHEKYKDWYFSPIASTTCILKFKFSLWDK